MTCVPRVLRLKGGNEPIAVVFDTMRQLREA
jgi:hypothetical protein